MAQGYQFNEHDLGDIFKEVWGYSAFPFQYKLQNKVEDALFPKSPANGQFAFGTPAVRRELSILGDPFYALNSNGNEVYMPIWLKDSLGNKYLLPNTVMDMSNQITMVEEPMVNRKGSVHEEVSVEDWIINVKGVIVSADMDYPDEGAQLLSEWYDKRVALDIINARTSLFLHEQEKVIIKSLKIHELKGRKHTQPFELTMVSDLDFQLIIK